MAATTTPVIYHLPAWIQENKQYFLPPVCNKMMHNNGQMKAFFVGGPNQREDYHIEMGDELFYMNKGDMCLKVVTNNTHRDVHIKEGQLFLLPGRIAHSPQRQADTIGMVLERERALSEKDGLRYFVKENGKPTLESLYEEWFHCVDLGTQLAPVIKAFFASEQCKTGKPIPGTIPVNPPVELDSERQLEEPLDLQEWVNKHRQDIDREGRKKVFSGKYQFQVYVYGKGETSDQCPRAETYIWQMEGTSTVTIDDVTNKLNKDDTMLVPLGKQFLVKQEAGSTALVCYQDPSLVS